MKPIYFLSYLFIVLCSPSSWAQTITQTQKLVASDRENNEHFGYHVQVFEDFVFVPAMTEGSSRVGKGGPEEGAVYVYKVDSFGVWSEYQKLVGSDRSGDDHFGSAIERSNNFIIIGAKNYGDNDNGAAYIFELVKDKWVEVTRLAPSNIEKDGRFGVDVSIAGDYAVVGAYGHGNDPYGDKTMKQSGAAYIFKRDSITGRWSEYNRLVSPNRIEDGRFGHDVYITNKYLAISAIVEGTDFSGGNFIPKAGAVYTYELNDRGEWRFQQKITHSDRFQYDYFGDELHINGEQLFISAKNKYIGDKQTAGAVYYFEKQSDGNWIEKQKIISPDREHRDLFGYSVDVQDDILLVSGDWRDLSGAGYVFIKNECGIWVYQTKVTAFGELAGAHSKDAFGCWLAMSESYMLFGAIYDDNAPGKEDLYESGSAFIFKYEGFEALDRSCKDYKGSNGSGTFVDSTGMDNNSPIKIIHEGPIIEEPDIEDPVIDSIDTPVVQDTVITEIEVVDSSDTEVIDEEEEETRFTVTPNPNNGQFNIEIIGPINGSYEVDITKPFGRIIKELTLTERVTSVQLGREARGAYVVKIFTEEGVKTFPIYVNAPSDRQ